MTYHRGEVQYAGGDRRRRAARSLGEESAAASRVGQRRESSDQILEGGLEGSEPRGNRWVEREWRGLGRPNCAYQMGQRVFAGILGLAGFIL